MLFDLRGRGRRGVVRVIYGALAVLFGSGLVLFGVGGFGGTGILSSLTGNEGSSHASFSAQISRDRKLTREKPRDAGAWEALAKDLLHEASGEAFVTSAGTPTSKGKELFKQASQAWESYIALNPPKPSSELAQLMATVYGEDGLNEPAKAVEVLQIAITYRPTDAALYGELAEYAYKAHNTRVGDLASTKAVALAPASDRTRVQKELNELKNNPSGEKTYTTTTDGKTLIGHLNSKGEIKASEVKGAGSSSGKKK